MVDGHSGRCGAVAGLKHVKNPIQCARALLNTGRHSFVFGQAAEDIGEAAGLCMVEISYFTTPNKKTYWESRMTKEPTERAVSDMGTVGAVALDIHGHLAAAGSTGGDDVQESREAW